jgi:hypothetical protein
MPEDDYSPMWHIGFAHWNREVASTDEVFIIKGLDELKALRDEGKVMIHEWPAASPAMIGSNDYNFESLKSPHVVYCPKPVTIDMALHGLFNNSLCFFISTLRISKIMYLASNK